MTITSFNLVTKGKATGPASSLLKSFVFSPAPRWGIRHLQVLFLFTCCSLMVAQRMNMSVAIVALTNANSSNPNYPEYHLTEKEKSYTLSSPFWGSCLTQLMSGYLSSRFGAKMLLLVIVVVTSLISIATSMVLAWGGWQLLFGVRFVQGLVMGGMWPCLYTHLAKWCPKREANRLGGVMATGLDVGTILGFAMSGILAASPLGWPSSFYVPGGQWKLVLLINCYCHLNPSRLLRHCVESVLDALWSQQPLGIEIYISSGAKAHRTGLGGRPGHRRW